MPTRRSRRAGKIFPSMPLPCAAASGESRTEADRTLLKPLFDFLRSLGAARIAAMGAVSLGLIGFLAWFVMRLSTSPLVPLYTDLTFEDSNAIISELDSRAIDYELRQDGAVVLVPSDQVLRLRMDLAADGLPHTGVMEAVCGLLPGESPRTRAEVQARFGQAPPGELVGLDPLDRNRPHLAEEHA